MQEAMPVLLDLAHQTCHNQSHFSRQYMEVVVGEVQAVLAQAGRNSAALRAKELLQASTQEEDLDSFQQMLQDTVRSSQVCTSQADARATLNMLAKNLHLSFRI